MLLMTYLQNYVLPAKTKDDNFKVLNLIKRKNEVKSLVNHILCNCK